MYVTQNWLNFNFLLGNLTEEQYIHVLENSLLLPAPDRFPNGFSFIQDNSSNHTAKIVQKWFAAHPFIEKLDFPAKAPDMNPIENVWGLMVKRLNSENLKKEIYGLR